MPRTCLVALDDTGDRALARAEVAGNPMVAPHVVYGMDHLRGEPISFRARAGPSFKTSVLVLDKH